MKRGMMRFCMCVIPLLTAGVLTGCGREEKGSPRPAPETGRVEETAAPAGWEEVLKLTNHANFSLAGSFSFCENIEWNGLDFSGSHSYEGDHVMNKVKNEINVSGRVSPGAESIQSFRMDRKMTYLELPNEKPLMIRYEVADIPISSFGDPAPRHMQSPLVSYSRSESPESALDMVKSFEEGQEGSWGNDINDALETWKRYLRSVDFRISFSRPDR